MIISSTPSSWVMMARKLATLQDREAMAVVTAEMVPGLSTPLVVMTKGWLAAGAGAAAAAMGRRWALSSMPPRASFRAWPIVSRGCPSGLSTMNMDANSVCRMVWLTSSMLQPCRNRMVDMFARIPGLSLPMTDSTNLFMEPPIIGKVMVYGPWHGQASSLMTPERWPTATSWARDPATETTTFLARCIWRR